MLAFSTRGRYATRIMIYLALRQGDRPVRKHEIVKAEGITPDYAEQILVKLKTAGLVTSFRGKKGGFALARKPANITVADVIAATEGPVTLAPCMSETCDRSTGCVARSIWVEAAGALNSVLSKNTIGALAHRAESLREESVLSYQI